MLLNCAVRGLLISSHHFNGIKCSSVVVVVQWLSCVRLFATPWTAARQPCPSFTISQSLLSGEGSFISRVPWPRTSRSFWFSVINNVASMMWTQRFAHMQAQEVDSLGRSYVYCHFLFRKFILSIFSKTDSTVQRKQMLLSF